MIRLLNTTTLEFELFPDSGAVSYVILSHRWRDGEVRFEEMALPSVSKKPGYQKIQACCQLAVSAGIRFAWVDTCCIDKRSSAELSEAINSMYRWYADSAECYAYLDDVISEEDVSQSEWFSRCWTLQELIAPKRVSFFKKNWQAFGTKRSLRHELTDITRIPLRVLKGGRISSYSIAQRMSWASKRKCTQIEDEAYSLLGMFEVNMPLIYGEQRNAFIRLQEEIIKNSEDHSIFACSSTEAGYRGLLATSPEYFLDSSDVCEANPPILARWQLSTEDKPCEMTSRGLHLSLNLFSTPVTADTYIAQLNCTRQSLPEDRLGIYLSQVEQHAGQNSFARVTVNGQHVVNVGKADRILIGRPRSLYVVQNERKLRSIRVKRPGFAVSSHIPYTCHNQYPVNDDAFFVEIPETVTGHVATLRMTDPNSKLGAVVLGFDTNFYPVCTLLDRDAATKLSESMQAYDHKWIEEKLTSSQKVEAVMLWRIAHTPGVWYFNVPAKRVSSSEIWYGVMKDNKLFSEAMKDTSPNLEPFLSVFVKELDVAVRIINQPYGNSMTWTFQLMKFDDCSDCIASVFEEAEGSENHADHDASETISVRGDSASEKWIQLSLKPNKASAWGELADFLTGRSSPGALLDESAALKEYENFKKLGLAYEVMRFRKFE